MVRGYRVAAEAGPQQLAGPADEGGPARGEVAGAVGHAHLAQRAAVVSRFLEQLSTPRPDGGQGIDRAAPCRIQRVDQPDECDLLAAGDELACQLGGDDPAEAHAGDVDTDRVGS